MGALCTKSNREILLQLCACLDHTLLFSSINRRWPEQREATLRLIHEGRRRGGYFEKKAPTRKLGP